MQWIKASERLPELYKDVYMKIKFSNEVSVAVGCFCNYHDGILKADTTIGWGLDKLENIEWLDETAPSFTLPEALEIYHNAWAHGVELSHPIAEEFFKHRFNIEI